jgi:cystathionine beta-synthase
MARRITREEGILAGESCGTAVLAALDEAGRLMAADPNAATAAVMVVILPDGGRSYMSKLYNDEWMRANGMLDSVGAVVQVGDLLRRRHEGAEIPAVVVARTTQRVGDAIENLQRYGISQMPVSEAADGAELPSLVGSVTERGLLDRAYRDPAIVDRTVGEVMGRPVPQVDERATLDEAFGLLAAGTDAVLVTGSGRALGVVTKLDLLEHLAHARG